MMLYVRDLQSSPLQGLYCKIVYSYQKFLSLGIRLGVKGAAISIHRSLSSNDDVSIKDVIKEIINSIEYDED